MSANDVQARLARLQAMRQERQREMEKLETSGSAFTDSGVSLAQEGEEEAEFSDDETGELDIKSSLVAALENSDDDDAPKGGVEPETVSISGDANEAEGKRTAKPENVVIPAHVADDGGAGTPSAHGYYSLSPFSSVNVDDELLDQIACDKEDRDEIQTFESEVLTRGRVRVGSVEFNRSVREGIKLARETLSQSQNLVETAARTRARAMSQQAEKLAKRMEEAGSGSDTGTSAKRGAQRSGRVVEDDDEIVVEDNNSMSTLQFEEADRLLQSESAAREDDDIGATVERSNERKRRILRQMTRTDGAKVAVSELESPRTAPTGRTLRERRSSSTTTSQGGADADYEDNDDNGEPIPMTKDSDEAFLSVIRAGFAHKTDAESSGDGAPDSSGFPPSQAPSADKPSTAPAADTVDTPRARAAIALEYRVQQLQVELERVSRERDRATKEREALRDVVRRQEERVVELERAATEHPGTASDVREDPPEKMMPDGNSTAGNEVEILREKVAALLQEVTVAEKKVEEARTESVASIQSLQLALRTTKDLLQQRSSDLDAARSETRDLRAALSAAEAAAETAKSASAAPAEPPKAAQDALTGPDRDQELSAAAERCTAAEARAADAEKRAQAALEKVEEMERARDENAVEVEALRETADAAGARVADLRKQLEERDKWIDAVAERQRSADEDRQRLQKQLDERDKEIDMLRGNSDSSSVRSTTATNSLRTENEQLRKRVKTYKEAAKLADDISKALEQRVEKLRARAAAAEQELTVARRKIAAGGVETGSTNVENRLENEVLQLQLELERQKRSARDTLPLRSSFESIMGAQTESAVLDRLRLFFSECLRIYPPSVEHYTRAARVNDLLERLSSAEDADFRSVVSDESGFGSGYGERITPGLPRTVSVPLPHVSSATSREIRDVLDDERRREIGRMRSTSRTSSSGHLAAPGSSRRGRSYSVNVASKARPASDTLSVRSFDEQEIGVPSSLLDDEDGYSSTGSLDNRLLRCVDMSLLPRDDRSNSSTGEAPRPRSPSPARSATGSVPRDDDERRREIRRKIQERKRRMLADLGIDNIVPESPTES